MTALLTAMILHIDHHHHYYHYHHYIDHYITIVIVIWIRAKAAASHRPALASQSVTERGRVP
jgi:hypothetical protein